MKNNIEWNIHLCASSNYDECRKQGENFLPYTCKAHKYGKQQPECIGFQRLEPDGLWRKDGTVS